MRRLPEAIKRRIVDHLACARTYPQVTELIVDEFDVHVTPRHVRAYDPTSPDFAGGQHWFEHYDQVRRNHDEEVGRIAIASKAFRMTQLQILFDKAMERGNVREARALLEQAAKEMGGRFVSRAPKRPCVASDVG